MSIEQKIADAMKRRFEQDLLGAAFGTNVTTGATPPKPLTMDTLRPLIKQYQTIPGLVEWAQTQIPAALEALTKEGHTPADVESWTVLIPESTELGFKDGECETVQTKASPIVIRCSKYTPNGVYLVPQLNLWASLKPLPFEFRVKREQVYKMDGATS